MWRSVAGVRFWSRSEAPTTNSSFNISLSTHSDESSELAQFEKPEKQAVLLNIDWEITGST